LNLDGREAETKLGGGKGPEKRHNSSFFGQERTLKTTTRST